MSSQLHREKEVALKMLSRGIRVAVTALDVTNTDTMLEYATRLSTLHGVLRKTTLWVAASQPAILLHELKADVDAMFKFCKYADATDAKALRLVRLSIVHIIDVLAVMQELVLNG